MNKNQGNNIKKVLHISPGFTGGIATHINNMVIGSDSSKLIIDVAAFPADKDNALIFRQDIIKKNGKIFELISPKKNPIRFIKQIQNIIKYNDSYELIHIHMFGIRFAVFSLIFRICGCKRIVSHAHIANEKESSNLKNKIKHWIDLNLTKIFATQYVSCSKLASEYVYGKRITKDKRIMHIPNSIDVSKFDFEYNEFYIKNMKGELSIRSEEYVIGHIGYFGYQKNHIFMIKIIENMSKMGINFKWIFIGEGSDKNIIEKLVSDKNLGEYVKFLGFRDDIPQLLKLMDIMVLPSIFEGLPTVVIEAQAAGTPCIISTNVSPETNLDIDLCEAISLDSDIEYWSTKIIDNIKLKRFDSGIIRQELEKKFFTMTTAAELYRKFVFNEITHYELS